MSEVYDVILGGLDTEVNVTIADSTGVDPSVLLAIRGEKGDTGEAGINGQDGRDGTDGADGFSPSASVSKVGDTATITITDKDGTTTASISDGGGGGASAFVAEFNVTPYADVKDAYDDDAIIICTADDSGNTMVLQLVYFDATNEIFFFAEPNGDGLYWTELSNANGWDDGTRYLASTDVATQLADGLMSALDKQKLDGLSKRNIWYGTCSTSASQSPKAITTASGDFSLTNGSMLVVKFSNTNSLSSASLQVDGGTSKSVYQLDGTSNIANRWGGGEVVMFAYDGTKFILLDQSTASTTQYGITKLNNTVTSTSTSEAATANAVKTAYDNGGVQSVNGSTGAVSLSIHNVPSGGTSGQVLSKASGTDYDLAWINQGGGLIDMFYPVGSFYETSDGSFDPNVSWGGTWILEGAGVVHLSAGTGYTIGSSGGSKDAIIPYHNHTASGGAVTDKASFNTDSSGSCSITSSGGHSHTVTSYYRSTASYGTGTAARPYTSSGSSSSTDWASIASNTGTHTHTVPDHTHSLPQHGHGFTQPTISYAGTDGNVTDANLPPYIVVNRWHRTA